MSAAITREQAALIVDTVNEALIAGHPPPGIPTGNYVQGAYRVAAGALDMRRNTVRDYLEPNGPIEKMFDLRVDHSLWNRDAYDKRASKPERPPEKAPEAEVADAVTQKYGIDAKRVEGKQQGAWVNGPAVELFSDKDNRFFIGACGDLHAGSKYTRWDVREDLFRRYERANVQAIFDTGNWIDGDASFNRHDVEVQGLARQVSLLVERHPRVNIPIFAVTGDDHEGWYEQREGIDVGWYCEQQMRAAGHDWTNLGYMEAHVKLTNSNTGKSTIMSVVHPGGGSAYATSYAIQKILESLEGGEKPAVALYGHYHKLLAGIERNVWYAQTGCAQDPTPFMRKKKLSAHVGGLLIGMEQDPATGAIIGFTPQIQRYFNAGYYDVSNRWSKHGPVDQQPRERGSGA